MAPLADERGRRIPGARPSRAELVGTDDAIAILVYQAFGGGGVDDPLLADALFALHEALKGTDLRGGVEGSSHAALDQVIASSLYEAVAAGRLAFEIVSPGPWPFADVPDDRPVLGPDDTPPDETSFVAVRLVDQTGAPLARRRFILGTPDRDERTGTTDGTGRARFDGVRPGSCSVVFDDFDVSDFREQVAQPGARSELEKGPVLCDAEGAVVTVGTGDTLASLAARSGFERFETLWNAPANAKLRSRRDNPMALLEGDQVAVPEKRGKTHHAATGTETKVVVFTGRLTLRIRLEDVLGQPRAGAPCAATADGATTTGATDGDGVFEIPITKTTRAVTLEADGARLRSRRRRARARRRATRDGAAPDEPRLSRGRRRGGRLLGARAR